MRRTLLCAALTAGALMAATGAANAADVRASGHAALLPGGTHGAVAVGSGTLERTSSAGGLRPAGGGTISSITTTVGVADRGRTGEATGSVTATGLSLFEGRVTIDAIRMSARVDAGPAGSAAALESATVEGLVVNGRAVAAGEGSRIPVEGIGTLVFFERSDTGSGMALNAMRVEVTDPAAAQIIGTPFVVGHLDLEAIPGDPEPSTRPATTTAPRSTTTAPRSTTTTPATPVTPRTTTRSPLTAPTSTPLAPLPRQSAPAVTLAPGDGYAFPVFGDVGYSDDYMAARAVTVVHHGIDLFAETGTPVVAVADGTLSKVGVNTLGGNRLWLTDERGNWFYYAHLSAFAPASVDGAQVRRGQVIGFVGNTGQAITTPPHLHFEIHPGGIDEDSINPYPFLLAWERGAVEVPRAFREGGTPATPTAPVGAVLVDAVPDVDRPESAGDGIAAPAR